MDLYFANENDGWTSCLGRLWRTSDGGRTWQENQYTSKNGQFPEFHFFGSKMIWASTLHSLQKSEDSGNTWKNVSPPISDDGDIGALNFLEDGKHGWLSGDKYVSCSSKVRDRLGIHGLAPDQKRCVQGVIFYTEDGGETWSQQFLASELGFSIGPLYIATDNRIWTFVYGHVAYFADGKWTEVDYAKSRCKKRDLLNTLDPNLSDSGPVGPEAIFFLGNTGWLSFSNGYLAKSTDSGMTWCDLFNLQTITRNPRYYFRKLYFNSPTHGWSLADRIYETHDGGVTWRTITDQGFEDMYFLGDRGWAISGEGLFHLVSE